MATVLVADDDTDTRDAVRMLLEAEGYVVLEARDGIEALHLLRCTPAPLVVLLDLQMPHLDGERVLWAVAADKRLATRNRYILMTVHAHSLPLTLVRVLAYLHVPVLAKPFEVEPIVALVAATAQALPAR
jgi:CheY-like chemotaxis protein